MVIPVKAIIICIGQKLGTVSKSFKFIQLVLEVSIESMNTADFQLLVV